MPALRGVPLVIVTTSIALVGALVVRNDPRAVALLGVVCFVVFLAYRGYVRQTQGHEQVEGLYSFTRALDDSLDSREVARTVLSPQRLLTFGRGLPGSARRLGGPTARSLNGTIGPHRRWAWTEGEFASK